MHERLLTSIYTKKDAYLKIFLYCSQNLQIEEMFASKEESGEMQNSLKPYNKLSPYWNYMYILMNRSYQ